MANQSYFTLTAADWKITGYGDVGGYLGYGGKVSHMKFHSPSLKLYLNAVHLQVGLGAGADISPKFLSQANTAYENFIKGRDAYNTESRYTPLICHRPFSLNDIDHARSGSIDTAVSIPFGYKTGFCHVSNDKGLLLFSVPASVDACYGFKFEASMAGGIIFSLGNEYLAAINESRKNRELSRRPSDPLVRPAGGF